MVNTPKKAGDIKGSFPKQAAPQEEGALLFRIRNGDDEAFRELLGFYEGMLRKLSRSFSFVPQSETEDLYQDGLIGFYKAALFYDSASGAFSTFAYLCARRNMLSAIKKLSRGTPELSVEELELDPESTVATPEQELIDSEAVRDLWRSFDDVLSDYECAVLKLTLAGGTPRSIAARLQKSEKGVSNALFRAKQKLSRHYRDLQQRS